MERRNGQAIDENDKFCSKKAGSMKTKRSFTLIELLIAMSISGFIVLGMTQASSNIQKILIRIRGQLHVDKSVALFFNQIERDFQTAFIPPETALEPTDEEKKKEEQKKKTKKPPAKGKKEEPKTLFFIGEIYEDASRKIDGKRYELFKRVSIVNTNPLQVWGQKRGRLVRVGYELLLNKEKGKPERESYDLVRRETRDLRSEFFKAKEDVPKEKAAFFEIREQIVARNIKELFVEYIMPKPKEKEKKGKEEEEETLELFQWGKAPEVTKRLEPTKNVVPEKVELRVAFWNDEMTREKEFQCTIPILSYPTEKEPATKKPQPKKKAPEKDEKEEGKRAKGEKVKRVPRR